MAMKTMLSLFILVYCTYSLNSLPIRSLPSPQVVRSQLGIPSANILLNVERQIYYYVEIRIGTPSQKERVLLDTGSYGLWVPWVNSSECGDQKLKFDPTLSESFIDLKTRDLITYAYTRVEGFKGKDVIGIGELQAQSQFLVVQRCYMFDITSNFDGILGLSAGKRFVNFLDQGLLDGQLVSSKFAFKFQKSFQNSSYLYYNISNEDFPSAFYLPVHDNIWCTKLSGVYVDTTYYPIINACMDTGAPYIYLPLFRFVPLFQTHFSHRCRRSNQTSQIKCECSQDLSEFPEISIETAKNRFILTPLMYIESNKCLLMIKPLNFDKENNTILLGPLFMRYYTTIFDKKNQQIGFVPFQIEQRFNYMDSQLENLIFLIAICASCGTGLTIINFLFQCNFQNKKLKQKLKLDAMIQMYVKDDQSQKTQETNKMQKKQTPMDINQ